jgi:hypothetical protein
LVRRQHSSVVSFGTGTAGFDGAGFDAVFFADFGGVAPFAGFDGFAGFDEVGEATSAKDTALPAPFVGFASGSGCFGAEGQHVLVRRRCCWRRPTWPHGVPLFGATPDHQKLVPCVLPADLGVCPLLRRWHHRASYSRT